MKPKHRIIRVWPFWPEGLKYHDHYLTEAMAKDGVETMFAYPHYNDESYSKFKTGDSPKDIESNSYSVFLLRYLNIFGKPFPFNGFSFINRIKEFKPNVVHIFGLSNFTTYFVLACLGVLRFKGTLVFNDHSDPTEKKTGIIAKAYYLLFKILYHLFIRNRFPVVVPDGGSERELITRYGESIKTVLRFIPLGFDSNSFNLGYESRSNYSPLVVGFAGKISSSKRIEALLTAVEDFCENDLEVRICGFLPSPDDYQRSLIKKIQTSKFKNIKVYDFLNKVNDLAAFYGAVDVAIFPGSISITTFEANGTGCPIVLYESLPGLEHRVSGGRGYLFSEVEQLKKHIQYYIDIKNNGGIEHEDIYRSSLFYSWGNLKFEYYKLYKWDITPIKNPDKFFNLSEDVIELN